MPYVHPAIFGGEPPSDSARDAREHAAAEADVLERLALLSDALGPWRACVELFA